MEPMRLGRLVLVLVAVSVVPLPGQETRPGEPATHLLEKWPPTDRYKPWWRPIRIIPEPGQFEHIETTVGAWSAEVMQSKSAAEAFEATNGSAFLFPVLVSKGIHAVPLLAKMIAEYAPDKTLDDRWLLIIATLAKIPEESSEKVLRAELTRVIRLYGKRPAAKTVDPRVPILDAILSVRAMRSTLDVNAIEDLCEIASDKSWFIWITGLEWVENTSTNAAVGDLVLKGLQRCAEEDLVAAMEGRQKAARIMAITDFLCHPMRRWPLVRECLLREDRISSPVVLEFLLNQYVGLLVLQADVSGGVYALDPPIVDLLSKRAWTPRKGLSVSCAILATCAPQATTQKWRDYVDHHAKSLPDAEKPYVAYWIKRISQGEKPNEYVTAPTLQDLMRLKKEPGVHMLGFRGAAGELPLATSAPS